ncbi:MAG: HD domain-containing protein [Clostridia bacterium]|nr:HD domain-containing protein [Clostridia bacterium]
MNLLNNSLGGNLVEGFCIIKSMEQRTTQRGQIYLDLVLSDAGGEISAKLWDYSEARHGAYASDDVIKVRGTVDVWNGSPQLRVERIRKANDADEVNYDALIETAPFSNELMYKAIVQIVSDFKDSDLRAIMLAVIEERREKLLIWPAAVKFHHAMRGGLLYHTLSIVRMAQSACKLYTFLDEELLVSGAILHDLAKIDELDANENGSASSYTAEGILLGHLVKGAINLDSVAKRLGTPEELTMLLQHMVISHHGCPEFGSAVMPMFPEAQMLALLDDADAKMFEFAAALEGVGEGEFSQKQWALDNRRIYNHGRGGYFKTQVLED